MTTKTTIISSPIRRCYTSPKLKKHRILKYRTIPSERINRSTEETISRIAMVLRNVGDQLDEQIRVRIIFFFSSLSI